MRVLQQHVDSMAEFPLFNVRRSAGCQQVEFASHTGLEFVHGVDAVLHVGLHINRRRIDVLMPHQLFNDAQVSPCRYKSLVRVSVSKPMCGSPHEGAVRLP